MQVARGVSDAGIPSAMNHQVSLRLDALRAIAALGTFCCHFAQPGLADGNSETLWAMGRMSVVAFFVLSGYVIAFAVWKVSYVRGLQPGHTGAFVFRIPSRLGLDGYARCCRAICRRNDVQPLSATGRARLAGS